MRAWSMRLRRVWLEEICRSQFVFIVVDSDFNSVLNLIYTTLLNVLYTTTRVYETAVCVASIDSQKSVYIYSGRLQCQFTIQFQRSIRYSNVNPLLKCQFKYSLFKMIFEWQIDAIQIFAIQIDI